MKHIARKLRPVVAKVLHSIADQGASSGTNFVMNVLLARWLSRTEYGAFSVCWSFCLVFAAFHNAIILEPMSVIGPSEYGSTLSGYLGVVGRINWYVIGLLSLVAAMAGIFYHEITVRRALLVLSICMPGYLLLLTVRREQYVLNQPLRAFHISLLYACAVAALLALCRAMSWLSALTGLICVAAALPVSLWAGKRFSAPSPGNADTGEHERIRPVLRAHWSYGRWLFASAILAIGISEIQTILLSVFVDLRAAGALRAMMNFVLPLAQLATVLSVYSLPRLADRMKRFGVARGLRQALFFPVGITVVAAVYVSVLDFLGPSLERVLYNGKMAEYDRYLPYLGVAALLSAIGAGFSTLLRAAQNSQHQFAAGLTATAVGVGAAIFLLRPYGVGGAIASMILANGASSACIIGIYIVIVRRRPASWSHAFADLFKDEPAADEYPAAAID